ncbi:rRNA maturation RNase YbeY [Rothia nasimurium]|uniref:rRNA maturation RNase YbeY n=1 Tax=Rothia nasimurium TaxID=85336 RepID=UPI001F0232C3|nr:rRNA maturation RNase YbeY [Rothia nasimurium]
MNIEFEIEELSDAASDVVRASFEAVDTEVLEKLVAHAFAHMKVSPETELSIAVVGEEEMERIHLDWMDLPGPTDVMSFPMDELTPGTDEELAVGVLGDIVLCPPVAARQGAEAGHSTLDELCLLTTHGILHCLGYDHATAEEEAEMFGIQRTILEDFLGRPAPVETRH